MDHLNANMLAWLENPIISKIGFVVLATVIAVMGSGERMVENVR